MAASKNIVKNVLFSLLLVVLFLPMLQQNFNFYELEKLNGDIKSIPDITVTKELWYSNEYQEKKESYLNSSFGFRNFFVRLNNQIVYSFFSKANANGVIIGKDNYLYEKSYINAYTGQDFIGEDSIQHSVNRLKFISDTLAKLNKQLIIVFAAGKASFYPEYIPDKYLSNQKDKTNYKNYVECVKTASLNVIDFNKWFVENKNKTQYPLYPQHGIHWSTYGTVLAADSLIKKIEQLRHIDSPNLTFTGVDMQQAHDVDYDIADGMNLLFKLKSFDVAYPKMDKVIDENKTKPKVLVISDSFYWGMYNLGIANCFQNDHFWYYNKQVFPESNNKETTTEQQDFTSVIANHEVIVIMATEATLRGIGWGFIERAEQYFKGNDFVKNKNSSPEYAQHVRDFVKYIKTQPKWLHDIENIAREKNISVDSVLVMEARWQVDIQPGTAKLISKSKTYSPEYLKEVKNYVEYIKTQSKWVCDAKLRALEKKITLDSMLVLEAMWQIDNAKK